MNGLVSYQWDLRLSWNEMWIKAVEHIIQQTLDAFLGINFLNVFYCFFFFTIKTHFLPENKKYNCICCICKLSYIQAREENKTTTNTIFRLRFAT